VRVHLAVEAQSDMSWVVIDDPVPAGAVVLGAGIGGQSALLQQGSQSRGVAWLAFEESPVRWLPRLLPIRAQRVAERGVHVAAQYPGTFILPATRVRGDVRTGDARRIAECARRGSGWSTGR